MVRDGLYYALALGLAAALLAWLLHPVAAVPLVAAGLFCLYFFRDPEREIPAGPVAVSPADGKVVDIRSVEDGLRRVSIFLNVFDVHVNRSPLPGTVAGLAYRPGAFFNASLDKASELNERQSIRLRLADGRELVVVQIAGLVARRIRCAVVPNQALRAGERIGLIRFGSRVDVYLPDGVSPLVAVGQRAVAGETVIADLQSTEPPRLGERH